MLLPPALGFSPHPPVSVYGTGTIRTIAAFLGSSLTSFPTSCFGPRHIFPLHGGFACHTGILLALVLPSPAPALSLRPHSSVLLQYRNLNLLSIGYVLRPRLRPRLTQSRSALLWKPWIFGLEDSHFYLATHSGILSSRQSTAPSGTASFRRQCSSTNHTKYDSAASVLCFSPGHFRRRTSRLVSYYALFEWMAASEPTS